MIGRRYPVGDLDPASPRLLSGAEYIGQKIRQVLLLIRGEWFLDLRLGTPWFEEVLVRNPSFEAIRATVRTKILSVPGVSSVPVLDLAFDKASRNMQIQFTAKLKNGAVVTDSVGALVTV